MVFSGKNTKKEKILNEAMQRLRSAREQIASDHPDLLPQMEGFVTKMHKEAEIREKARTASPEHIDRQKNIETAMKFLELRPQGDFMRKSVQALLKKAQH